MFCLDFFGSSWSHFKISAPAPPKKGSLQLRNTGGHILMNELPRADSIASRANAVID